MPRPIPTVSLRRALAWLSFTLLVAVAAFILWQELRGPQAVPVAPTRVVAVAAGPLDAPAGTGALRLAGAVVLSSADADFGGLSGLAALPDGRLLAVSDAGQWLRFTPVLVGGRLAGVAGAEMGAIPALGATKQDRDTEAIAFTAAGETLVSLEQQHRILRFAGIGPPRRLAGTLWRTEAISWPSNGGGETLAVLPDGAWLWVAESARIGDSAARQGLLIAADGATRTLAIPGLPGFSPTDAAPLPDGRLLLLHRLYNGVSNEAAITLVDLPAIRSGRPAPARLLARWGRKGPWPVDNMEGLALAREQGQPVLYIVSDNNFSGLQRTLLLRLVIAAPLDGDMP